MQKLVKILSIALLLTFLPLKHWGQTPYRQYADNGILLDFHEIEDVYFRAFLLYNLSQDDRFILMANEEPGQFSISSDESSGITNLYEAFDVFYNDTYYSFGMLDKRDVSSRFPQWKSCVASAHFQSTMMDITLRNSRPNDNNHCVDSDPFCTSDVITFDAATSSQTADDLEGTTLQDGCLSSSPNPSWYHMRIRTGGQFVIHMEGRDPSNGTTRDIDFCIWGPFDDPTSPCVAQLTTNKIIDCSFSASYTEDIYLGYQLSEHDHDGSSLADGTITYHVPEVGEYYILMICNYSQQPCTISFTKTEGVGETDCGILPGIVNNDGPYCVGETINLTVNQQAGATYTWTGPNGFTSSQQNPVRPNCTMNMAGTYTCVTSVGSQTTSATTEVVVFAQPTADFTATTVCQGNPTQFTSTSTTNPAGQAISSFQWRFGDGQTGTGQTISHTYAQPGTYQVTLTVSTGNGRCSHEITKTISVESVPEANFTATTVCQGEPTQFTSTSHGQNIDSYQWSFGDNQTGSGQTISHTYAQSGTYQVTLTVSSGNGTCTDYITQAVTVNSKPTASFRATSVCQGEPTQFTSTAVGDHISSYQWSFGDGQTGTGQAVSHTYAQPGNYPVTLNVQTSSGCSDSFNQTVDVYAMPVASASALPNTVNYGATTTLSANAGTQGTFNFHWEPADMVVNPNAQTTQTVALQESQTFTVTITNPQGGCTSTAQVIVSLDGSGLMAMATADQTELCDGESTTIHAIPSGGAIENYTFEWSPANTLNNANSQNPVATPSLGNTTYTCHVSDGFTDINVSVTLHVHPNVEKDVYQTICENDTYSFFGQDVHTPGVYDHTLHTQFGCDSIVHLHLDNWQVYETSTTDHFCQNDQYHFFNQTLDAAGTYYHTLQSVHGCDSTIRLTLLQDPVYEFEMWESTCEGSEGYLYAGQYLQPRIEPYIFNYPTIKQCDSTIIIHIEEAEYNSKNYNVSLCGTEYTWGSNGITYYETGVYYDTLHYSNTCDSTIVLNLELRPIHDDDIVVSSCDDYRWKNDTYNVDMTFTESAVYTQHYINAFGCESEATLYLTINDHDESAFIVPDDQNCDEYFWDPQGHEIVYTDHADSVYNISGIYHRTYKNQADCDSLVTMSVQFDYTPHPTPIYPMDNENTTPHWVVTATEFQINAYDFNLWDTNPNCNWDTVTWTCEGAPNWIIEPFGDQGKCCKLYVLNSVEDTIWLTAHAFNRCAPDDGIIQRYWLVCSFYGLDEQDAQADFYVVPNPNKGQMTLNFEHLTGKVNIKVYDMHGALIDQFETYSGVGPNTYQYQMKSKAEGIYFIVATSKEGTMARKVIIQR